MANQIFVVVTKQKRFIVLHKDWIAYPKIGQHTKVFYSPNPDQLPNFALEESYMFNGNEPRCYNAKVMQSFPNKEAAEKFVS